jgi:hypothetical protein
MALISADRMKTLKARVKAECQRRNKTDNIASYGDTGYDYTTIPALDGTITLEHRDKIAIPLNAINPDKVTGANTQLLISDNDLTTMDSFLTLLEKAGMTTNADAGCKSGCAGACYSCTSTCEGSCTGCTGTCQGGCQGSCGDGCTADCHKGCNWCDNTCYATCMDWCQ